MLRLPLYSLSLTLVLVASAVRAEPAVKSVEREAGGPDLVKVLPDEMGGIWILAADSDERLFVKSCRDSRPEACASWVALDLGWEQRQTEQPVLEIPGSDSYSHFDTPILK